MYFQISRKKVILATGDDLLSFGVSYEINNTPQFSVQLPIKYYHHLLYRNEIVIKLDDGSLVHGWIVSKTINKDLEYVTVEYEHVLFEWNWESIPTNVSKKNESIKTLMTDPDIIYKGEDWDIRVYDDSEIEYEFSRESKRVGLDRIISLTADINYRVLRGEDRVLEIGKFGNHKQYMVSFDNIIGNLTIEDDNSNIINYAVALSDKNDGGSTSITLRDIFENPDLQEEGFPVIITGNKINTQSSQIGYSYTEYAPNTIHEYAVIDEEGIIREDGDLYESTFSSNDIQPIQEEGQAISNEDRIKSSLMLYRRAVRKLINSRRNERFEVTVADLPLDINVGDKIRVMFVNTHNTMDECSSEVISSDAIFEDSWLYVSNIDVHFANGGTTLYDLVLARDLTEYYQSREL